MAIDDLRLQRGDSAGTGSVRIPVLTQRTTVDRLPNSPRMQAPEISSAIGRALSGAGNALGDAARAATLAETVDMRQQELEMQNEREKQTLAAQKAVSESSLSLMTHFDEASRAAQPGAAGFTATLTKDIDAHIEAATKDASPFYKQSYERSMIGVRQHLLAKAQDYEFGEGLKLEVSNVNTGIEASQKLVYSDPSLLEQEIGRWGSTIDANTRFNPEAKRALKESARKQLVWAAGAKDIESNPVEWNAALNPYSPRNNPGAVSAARAGTISDLRAGQYDPNFGSRPDGSKKGAGFLGVLQRPDGSVMTEYSVGVNIGGKEVDVPTLVPTLTRGEVETLLGLKDGEKVPERIVQKATDFARQRIADGKPVFAQPGEQTDISAPASAASPATRLPTVNATVRSYAPIAREAANATGVDQNVLLAQIQTESAGNPRAYSAKGARGVSQFIPETAARYGVDVTSPQSSINGQARYMADLLEKFGGDYEKAIAAYNMGEGGPTRNNGVYGLVAKYGKDWLSHAPEETRNYVARVKKLAGMEGDAQVTVTALDGTPVPNAGMREKIGAPWFDLATFEEQQRFKQFAETKFNEFESVQNKQRQELATSLELETRNVTEMAQRGVAPQGQPKTLAEFQAAYQNPERASQAYGAYAAAWDSANTTAKFNGLPTTALAAVVQEPAPNQADPDFAVKSNFQQIRQQSAMRIIAARQKDPWAYAQATQDFGAGVADPSKPDFADVIKRRAAALPQMMLKYGVSNPSVLTETEAAALGQRMELLPADDRVATLKTLRGAIADDAVYGALLNTLRPDSPVTVMAGNIAAVGGTVSLNGEAVSTDKIASRIARGEDLLNPTKGAKGENGARGSSFPMPKENEMRTEWTSAVGKAYAGFPDAEAHAYQAYRAYYAARAAEKGLSDGVLDTTIASEAVVASTGGVAKMDPNGLSNSYRLVLPYGMPQDVFQDRAVALWNRIGPANGYTHTSIDDLRLRPTGENGRYLVTGPDGMAVPGADSKPIVMDFLAAPVVSVSQQEQRGTIKRN